MPTVPSRLRFLVIWTAAGLLGLAGCSGDDGPGDQAAASTTVPPANEVEPLAGPVVAPPEGKARVALGSSFDLVLTVTTCRRDPAAVPVDEVPAERLSIVASGERSDGTEVVLDLRRFASAGAAPTITDTITLIEGPESSPDRVLVAQRFEVGGVVTDLRDPDADDPLLRVTERTVEASGVFAPPGGSIGNSGLVAGAVAATCTG